jgi:hypothetical protein
MRYVEAWPEIEVSMKTGLSPVVAIKVFPAEGKIVVHKRGAVSG